jgi:dTDP-3-amino-3,4,6-trideoxy-alpha-D-glucose transaminase
MIGLNDFSRQWNDTSHDLMAAFQRVGESGWYILGREVQCFEQQLARYWGAPFAVGVASGLDALEIALRCVGCKPGDKVLTTPVSAFATTLAILKLRAVPVFADIDRFGLIDLDLVEEALRRDPTIRFFVPVHLYGHALDLSRIAALREKLGIQIVEDCAQSIGALFNGQPTGSAGRIAANSFYPTKNLGALGDGGAILCWDEGHAANTRALRDYGQTAKYCHDVVGYNSRLDELQAALLRSAFLPRLDRWIARRQEIAAAYTNSIRNPGIIVPGAPSTSHSSWHLFPVIVAPETKPAFLAHLKTCGIAAGEHYPAAIPDQKALLGQPFEIAASGIERARQFCAAEVSLPVHPYLLDSEAAQIIEAANHAKLSKEPRP